MPLTMPADPYVSKPVTLRMAIHHLEVASQAYGHSVGSGRETPAEREVLYFKVLEARKAVRDLLPTS